MTGKAEVVELLNHLPLGDVLIQAAVGVGAFVLGILVCELGEAVLGLITGVKLGKDFLGARLEEESRLRELHAPLLPREERRAELCLELLQLPRERRLRQMQLFRRPRDVLMARDRQEIFEYAKFHCHTPCWIDP